MAERLELLRQHVTDWLRRNELDTDLSFWTHDEWAAQNEDYLNDAELVITTEGGLWFLLNYSFDDAKVDEFQDLLASFGYWFDMGHSWSLGLYADERYDTSPTPNTYREKLGDVRWSKKADTVKTRAGHRCQDCGKSGRSLEAHHCWYKYGLEPWQYPLDSLRCLCRPCHERRERTEHDFRCMGAGFTWHELDRVRECLKRLIHWYDRSAVFAFLDAVGPDESRLVKAALMLVGRKTEPGRS